MNTDFRPFAGFELAISAYAAELIGSAELSIVALSALATAQ
jgi:hypothetical protein